MRAVIIDDELDARKSIKFNVGQVLPEISIIGEARDVASGVELIKKAKPELVFLDISMPDGTGFDLLNKFKSPDFLVVFITGYDEHAVMAFKFSAIDYILKPIDQDDLVTLRDKLQIEVDKAETKARLENLETALRYSSFPKLAVPHKAGTRFLDLDDIIYMESEGSYTFIFTETYGRLMISRNLKEFETLLPSHAFMRVHRSYIIHLRQVELYLKSDEAALLKNNKQIPVSRRKKNELLQKLSKIITSD